ncbi:MAG: hypothetical protein KF708_00520 [Pirellulales bacterium]|nr:hypothetical protein [Pirellulales bacterium]
MQWKALSAGVVENIGKAACSVCGASMAGSAFTPDFDHGDTPGSIEFLQECHSTDLSDEHSLVCSGCRRRIDNLLD